MKITLAGVILAAFLSISGFAQQQQEISAIERDFAKNRRAFKLEKFALGEDATSGFDYLIYKNKTGVRKIRVVWNGGVGAIPTVEDYYFENGAPAVYVSLSVGKSQIRSVVKGLDIPLKTIERLELKAGALASWVEKGKTIPRTDARWKEKETETLELFKDKLETYRMFKNGEL
jgi:hypothetical protein